VHVIDPVAHHVETAAALADVTAEVGDACHLSAAADSVDAVLLLGPLYHLPAAQDRETAIREARRVLRAGGVLVAAAISRYLSLLEAGTNGEVDRGSNPPGRRGDRNRGLRRTCGLRRGHWHTADELRNEIRSWALAMLKSTESRDLPGPRSTLSVMSAPMRSRTRPCGVPDSLSATP